MNKYIEPIISTDDSLAPLALRVTAGTIFAAHGAQKLFGWFGGYGLEGTGQYMASLGLEPGYLMALMAGSAEFFGGLALIAGILVRPAAAALAFTMVIAIATAHWANGFFLSNGGYEFGLALLGMSVALVAQGAGALSIDNAITQLSKLRPSNQIVTA